MSFVCMSQTNTHTFLRIKQWNWFSSWFEHEEPRKKSFQYENMEIIFVDHAWAQAMAKEENYFIIHSFSYYNNLSHSSSHTQKLQRSESSFERF